MKRFPASLLILAILVPLAAGCGRPARVGPRHAGDWQLLGKRTVNGKNDRDEISVTAREGTFRKIMFSVKGSKLEMYNVVVTFGNGETLSPDTRFVFNKGTRSRVIDLPGTNRVIRKVRFRYGNLPGGGRAHVSVFGR